MLELYKKNNPTIGIRIEVRVDWSNYADFKQRFVPTVRIVLVCWKIKNEFKKQTIRNLLYIYLGQSPRVSEG